ncbi:HNH endonuclease [Mesorhizobium sp. B283B1A]|uniref:HNH endonuclease signature motif containing protein n=1 Tax=Mesorhizobium TaxID=68287 RepID=UPI001CD16C5E|nr:MULTISPECIES: HNH endonuclease signature motif containing protein [Mesorhizobium]MCA0046667.1 HNH endonuclease [Mesorhizobium sp. B283B1A]UQS61972.1 HNH endonuclease [Mesorhizobium opportunistum]
MPIALPDTKILWGRAGGKCSNPKCRADLTKVVDGVPTFHIGEMAHVIAHSADGPRGQAEGGLDTYENLVLLCPNCHTAVDKAPAAYSEDLLRGWKNGREEEVEQAGRNVRFENFDELRNYIGLLLAENHGIFSEVGPNSPIANEDPGSDAVEIWTARILDTILPNNIKILNSIGGNISLLSKEDVIAFLAFKKHALAYEQQQFGRTEFYPKFPSIFSERFGYE